MFNDILAEYSALAEHIAASLQYFIMAFFAGLAVLEISIITGKHMFEMSTGDQLYIGLGRAILYIAGASFLFAFLPTYFQAGWEQIYKLAYKISGSSVDYSPSGLVDLLFKITGDIFRAASSEGKILDGTVFIYGLAAVFIVFIICGIFAIIIALVSTNYICWNILGAMGGIFICFFTLGITRPIFSNYIKYMLGLLLKTFVQLIFLGILVICIQNTTDYKKSLGPPPATPNCDQKDQAEKEYTESCMNNQYIVDPAERSKCILDVKESWNFDSLDKKCQVERKLQESFNAKLNENFVYRGLLLVVTMIMFLVLFMTIPNVVAGMVGFGDYSVKGVSQAMGMVAMGAAAAKMSKQITGRGLGAGSGAVQGLSHGNSHLGKVGGALGGAIGGALGGSKGAQTGASIGSSFGNDFSLKQAGKDMASGAQSAAKSVNSSAMMQSLKSSWHNR